MTRVKSLTRVIDFLFESSLSPAKNAKRLESDSDESLTRPNTNNHNDRGVSEPLNQNNNT
jgi:hypothetical protein